VQELFCFRNFSYFQEVIAKLCSSDVNDIEVMKDGTWTPLQVKKEPDEPPAKVS